ncbi:hypothetical protein RUM43_004565 [Polyplax serrata]
MRRHREEKPMNVSSLRRNIKNLAHNYTDAQVKVREATSNDPWGPSSTLMSEIADLTYNVVAFTEIMQMIWKRLNDHGKNWRHVYKALVLLEYLIKTGSEKVGQQCKENIYAIQTLKDFQHYEENKDQGINVREKAKQLVNLLKDEERLKNERAKALKAKERFAQTASGFGSDGTTYQDAWKGLHDRSVSHDLTSKELESARPQTIGEEELQLQLALAMSREEAEQEEQRRKSDDVRLQLALSQSQHEFKATTSPQSNSHVMDLLDVNLGNTASSEPNFDPWSMQQTPVQKPQADPWSNSSSILSKLSPTTVDPWAPVQAESQSVTSSRSPKPVSSDPWKAVSPVSKPQTADPWSPDTDHSSPHMSPPNDLDDFDFITNREKLSANADNIANNNGVKLSDPFDVAGPMDNAKETKPQKKSPHAFLGENSALVNLDNLVTVTSKLDISSQQALPLPIAMANPFAGSQVPVQGGAGGQSQNFFQQPLPPRPSINQIRQQPAFGSDPLPSPLVPAANPFLS